MSTCVLLVCLSGYMVVITEFYILYCIRILCLSLSSFTWSVWNYTLCNTEMSGLGGKWARLEDLSWTIKDQFSVVHWVEKPKRIETWPKKSLVFLILGTPGSLFSQIWYAWLSTSWPSAILPTRLGSWVTIPKSDS